MGSSAVPTSITVYDTMATIAGLNPNTWYEFFLETDCSGAGNGYSTTVGPYSVKTLCASMGTPIYEGFDNDSVGSYLNPNAPSCWYYVEETGAAGYGYIYNSTWSISPLSSSNYYYLTTLRCSYSSSEPSRDRFGQRHEANGYLPANTGWFTGNDVMWAQ